MTVEHALHPITNVALGRIIGLDHSSASRLRRGERGASVQVMLRIEDEFKWPVREQYAAFQDGSFASEFARRLDEWTATRWAERATPAAS